MYEWQTTPESSWLTAARSSYTSYPQKPMKYATSPTRRPFLLSMSSTVSPKQRVREGGVGGCLCPCHELQTTESNNLIISLSLLAFTPQHLKALVSHRTSRRWKTCCRSVKLWLWRGGRRALDWRTWGSLRKSCSDNNRNCLPRYDLKQKYWHIYNSACFGETWWVYCVSISNRSGLQGVIVWLHVPYMYTGDFAICGIL